MSERPDFILERLRLGEVEPVERARIEASLTVSEQARIEAMGRDDARLLAEHPPRVFALEVARRAAAARPKRAPRGWTFAAVGALAAACVAAWIVSRGPSPPTPGAVPGAVGPGIVGPGIVGPGPGGPLDTVRAKGDARLLVYRQGSAEEPEMLADGAYASPGDVLQLGVLLDAPRHVVIVSIDGRGAITRHFASPGVVDGKALVDHAFALDDAPDFERFVVVTAAEPLDPAVVEAAAKARATAPDADRAPLSLPADWSQISTLIRKETP